MLWLAGAQFFADTTTTYCAPVSRRTDLSFTLIHSSSYTTSLLCQCVPRAMSRCRHRLHVVDPICLDSPISSRPSFDAVACGLDLPDVENLSDIQHQWIFNNEIQVWHDPFVSYPDGSSDQTFARLVRTLERIDSNKITI